MWPLYVCPDNVVGTSEAEAFTHIPFCRLQREKNDDEVPEVAAALEGTLWSKQKRRRGNKDDKSKKPGGEKYKHFKGNVRKKGSKKRT